MIKWWKNFKKKDMERRLPGLSVKEASIKKKTDVAMAMLERRKEELTVENERRVNHNGIVRPA